MPWELAFSVLCFTAANTKKQTPRNPSCDIIMIAYSSSKGLKPLPRKGQTEVIYCYVSVTPPSSFMRKMKHALGLRVSQMFADSRGMGLCRYIKYWNCKWKQAKAADSQGQWPFSEINALWATRATFVSARESHALFRVCIMNETKGRRKPARDYFRKEMFNSESMFSVPCSLGTKQKRNPLYCSQHLTDTTKQS